MKVRRFNPMRVLVVEDSKHLRTAVAKALKRSGYAVDTAADGEEGAWLARESTFDVVVLDIMLPKKDGLEVLDELRRDGIETPVLLLTARNSVDDRVRGLRSGADDYLGKPFELAEFLARVDVLCRRRYGRRSAVVEAGDLRVDTNAKVARRGGQDLDLTAREYALLELLVMQPGRVLSRTRIEEHLYDGRGSRVSNVVDSTVYHLRRKLGPDGREIVRTRRGQGYVFEEARP